MGGADANTKLPRRVDKGPRRAMGLEKNCSWCGSVHGQRGRINNLLKQVIGWDFLNGYSVLKKAKKGKKRGVH